uniref:Uncharacterized protein n=1 Tax=Romanomermis culicivorax TaxID=13658 RepID=A0A915INH3_ROMCU
MFLEHSTTEDQRQTRKYQFDSDQINLISSSANNTINNCSNNNNNNKTTKDDRIWQFLKYKFRSLSRSGDRVSDDNDDEQQFLSPSSTATTPTAERKSIKDRLHAKFSFTFRRRTSSKKLLTRKANSECHTALNYIGNKDNSSLIAQTSEDASGAKIAAQKRKQLLFKRQDRYSCGAVGGATIGSSQQQENIPISCRIDTTFDKTPSSPTATKTIVNLSPAFEIGRRKNGIHFCSSVSHNGGNEIELDWSNRKFLTNRKSRDDYRLSDTAENFNNSEFETTERQNPIGRQVINALIYGKTRSDEESIYALSPTILGRKRSEKMNKEESTKRRSMSAVTGLYSMNDDYNLKRLCSVLIVV